MAKRGEKPIPKGRVRRTAKVGRLAGGQMARNAATKATNVARSPEGRRTATERRQIQAAEQIVNVLGTMKGAAMKVGQVASFIDVGGLPPEARDLFQAKLAELRDAAPQVSFKEMRKVIEADLEEPLDEVFAEFEEEAVAAASIGQVYRARLNDGRRVAVKVQYPGVGQAVRADLQNLGLLLRAARTMAPGLDAKAVAAEIRDRLTEELDYEHEAQSQRAMARVWRGHPFVVVPDVVTGLSRERVLVSEWVDGIGFEEVKQLPQDDRNRFGEIVFRFFVGSLWRTGFFSGDPHPGNYLLLEDGRVAFLDFGMTKKLSFERLSDERRMVRAALDGDAEGFHEQVLKSGYYQPDDEVASPERVMAHAMALTAWEREDREFTISREYVAQVLVDSGDPRSEYWDMMRRGTVPVDSLLAGRMTGLTLAVLGQLNATANWHRIVNEIVLGGPPGSPLGEREAGFWDDPRRAPARRRQVA
jgi:predicted unusual protein kinase regulating ubiquinone biosynthesis (AarF/ABC1/UbiB family)